MPEPNKVRLHRLPYREIRGIASFEGFHEYLFTNALDTYRDRVGGAGLGSVLAVCGGAREVRYLRRYPFDQITVSGIFERGDWFEESAEGDERVAYRRENCESLSFPTASHDLVFCKEGLHHLARPVLGLYEMLRVCRKAAIFIEPYESPLERLFEKVGVATKFERKQSSFQVLPTGSVVTRDNYVYHWTVRQLRTLLNSYYLDSGYELELHLGWIVKRIGKRSRKLMELVAASGSAATFVPGARGNIVTALVFPGASAPEQPVSFQAEGAQAPSASDHV
ncbi:MAG: class I SAM-dependent methyltransferase [Actinomycetota bacterium]